jgi:DNA repair protein RadC
MAPKPPTRKGRLYRLPVYTVHLVREAAVAFEAPEEAEYARSPLHVANILRRYIGPKDREHCVALLLDSKNGPIGVHTVSVGSLSEAIVHPREVFKVALLAGAASVIVGHNHPSGDPTPSPEDHVVARRLWEAGRLLGVDLLDFLIVGHLRHHSFKEHGRL